MAARAYDVAAYCLKGHKAHLNFPQEIDQLPRPSSSTARDIQTAAALAAKMVAEKSAGGDDFWAEIELPELMENSDHISEAQLMKLPRNLLAMTSTIKKNTELVLEQMPLVISSLDTHVERGLHCLHLILSITALGSWKAGTH